MTKSVCPTCHNKFTDINRHWQRSWSCNPLNKKPSDPYLAVHHDLQQQQQLLTNLAPKTGTKGNHENNVMTEAGLLDDFPLPGDDTILLLFGDRSGEKEKGDHLILQLSESSIS
jgi:hypothetical protein